MRLIFFSNTHARFFPLFHSFFLAGWLAQGDDGARKRIRAWLRTALCARRPSESAAAGSVASAEAGNGSSSSGGVVLSAAAAGEALAAQARCPRWEPLKESVVWGDADAALPTWPLNPLVRRHKFKKRREGEVPATPQNDETGGT